MRRTLVLIAALALVSASCDGLPFGGGGGDERIILVDYSHDEFASFTLLNLPKKVAVTPGMILNFRQTWTGEPHTVTGGSVVDDALSARLLRFVLAFEALTVAGVPLPNPDAPEEGSTVADALEAVEKSDESEERTQFLEAYEELIEEEDFPTPEEAEDADFGEFVEEVDPKIEEIFGALPFAFIENEDVQEAAPAIAQNVGQPCYLTRGGPPKDQEKACDEQEQPDFNGEQSFYNSGIIPYEGANGNMFNVKLADDIDPGNYWFYCAVHGFRQSTEVEVRPEGSDIPPQAEVSRAARAEIEEVSEELEEVYRRAVADGEIEIVDDEGEKATVEGPFAGLYTAERLPGSINEFVPKNLTVKRDEPITWKIFGADHTITFGVPRYFPVMQFQDDGTVRLNPRLGGPAGGAREAPEQEGMGVFKVDGGTYDGTGFWSSGLVGAGPYLEYTMRISRPGTYDFACLIHPPMVGDITVT